MMLNTPNLQEKAKQYHAYGFTPKEIAERLQIDLTLVQTSLDEIPGDTRLWHPCPLGENAMKYTSDRTIPAFELLHQYDATYIQAVLDEYGFTGGAKILDTRIQDLYVLKRHFSYYEPLPEDAAEQISY